MKHRRTAKELLVHFLKAKADVIAKYSNLVYLDAYDYNEILGWSEEECREILYKFVETTTKWGISDSTMCPWCLQRKVVEQECVECTYAARHTCCFKGGSLYQTILEVIRTNHVYCITDIPRVRALCERYLDIFKIFLQDVEK